MLLNLNDPESIVAWWKVYPDQHQNYLDYKLCASPEFGPAILEALRRINDDPCLSDLLSRAVRSSRHTGARESQAALAVA